METKALKRRTLLRGAGASLSLAPLAVWGARPVLAQTFSKSAGPVLYAARADMMGQFGISAVDAEGEILFDLPLPERAHDSVIQPQGPHIAVISRRPGRHIYLINRAQGRAEGQIEALPGHHFYGHAAYSLEGDQLFVPEHNLAKECTQIGLYDAKQAYKRIGHWDLPGPTKAIGAHELVLSPDGKELCLALGGILTRPETGRQKHNLDTMRPALIRLDRERGQVQQWLEPPRSLHQASIRHLDVNAAGDIAIGLQYQGSKTDKVPLVAVHKKGEAALRFLTAPDAVQAAMTQYCGSVRFDRSGRFFAVSHPRGGLISFWSDTDAKTVQFSHDVALEDGCGVAASAVVGGFFLTGGLGQIQHHHAPSQQTDSIDSLALMTWRWDNHLTLS